MKVTCSVKIHWTPDDMGMVSRRLTIPTKMTTSATAYREESPKESQKEKDK